MVLEAIRYRRGDLQILDQLLLPSREKWVSIPTTNEAWHAIQKMQVRGAPAIAIVAALSVAVELESKESAWNTFDLQSAVDYVIEKLDYLVTSRPTAVNLSIAATKLSNVTRKAASCPGAQVQHVFNVYMLAAEKMLEDDVADNKNIGRFGAQYIMGLEKAKAGEVSVVTHCNTGSLATAGYGTALGVVRTLHELHALRHVFCTETRPYNQGSRLTAFELVHDKIPATLITDSAACALLHLRSSSDKDNIAAVVTGADRVAANGDTANKIGTYALAIAAKHHDVQFLIAAPRTTIDLNTASGADIVIEERPQNEVTAMKGPVWDGDRFDVETIKQISIACREVEVWNPAFDVTPADLIDGIVTEVGVAEKGDDGKFNLKELFNT